MIRIRTTSHDPGRLRTALAGAATVVVDLETTGLHRHDGIVTGGVLIDRDAHILIKQEHRDLSSLAKRVGPADLRHALEPLTSRTDLVAVFHHAAFDVAMLERAGVPVNCCIHDTMKLLKLYDSDPGREVGDGAGTGSRLPRFQRRYKEALNYKLKGVSRHLLNLQAREFPGDPSMLPRGWLVPYLTSDLLVTRQLYDWLQRRLTAEDRDYNARLIAPITSLLVRMSLRGVLADPDFIAAESERLLQLMAAISAPHSQRFGQRLDVGDFHLHGWIYFRGLRCRIVHSGKKRLPSLRAEDLVHLYHEADSSATRDSLALLPHCWTLFAKPPGYPGRTVPCPKCGNPLPVPSRYPQFDPSQPCGLVEDFRRGGSDIYSVAVERILGHRPRDASEREHMKQTILGIVNGMGVGTLARRLRVPREVAASYLDKFAEAYPEVVAFTELMHHAFALTGEARTFAGRRRRVTAHWWLVNKPVVELFISYKGADKLWLRVVPLEASRYTLTCWVLRVIDARYGSPNEGQEIYHHKAGRISQAPYRFFDDGGLIFRLPVRNVPWRIIRRVRTRNEEPGSLGVPRPPDRSGPPLYHRRAGLSLDRYRRRQRYRIRPFQHQLRPRNAGPLRQALQHSLCE